MRGPSNRPKRDPSREKKDKREKSEEKDKKKMTKEKMARTPCRYAGTCQRATRVSSCVVTRHCLPQSQRHARTRREMERILQNRFACLATDLPGPLRVPKSLKKHVRFAKKIEVEVIPARG